MGNYTDFTMKTIDAAYINSLVDLVNACRENNVEINEVRHFQNGWHVTFTGYPHADAVCHDGSYGSPCPFWLGENRYKNDWTCHSGLWETIGFPWDYDDVSTHNAQELAHYLAALNRGEAPWKNNEDC